MTLSRRKLLGFSLAAGGWLSGAAAQSKEPDCGNECKDNTDEECKKRPQKQFLTEKQQRELSLRFLWDEKFRSCFIDHPCEAAALLNIGLTETQLQDLKCEVGCTDDELRVLADNLTKAMRKPGAAVKGDVSVKSIQIPVIACGNLGPTLPIEDICPSRVKSGNRASSSG